MAEISRVLEVEQTNPDRIHLFRDGMFLRAHQRSAYRFIRSVRAYALTKKHYKAVDADVVYLGFPSNILETMVPPAAVETVSDGHLSILCTEPFDEKDYQSWFASIPVTEKKERKVGVATDAAVTAKSPDVPDETSDGVSDGARLSGIEMVVLRRLADFQVENSTPMQCMNFVSGLKSDLKNGMNGGL